MRLCLTHHVHDLIHKHDNNEFYIRFELKPDFERKTLHRLWEWNKEQDYVVKEDEMIMMKQKFAEQLRQEQLAGDEL